MSKFSGELSFVLIVVLFSCSSTNIPVDHIEKSLKDNKSTNNEKVKTTNSHIQTNTNINTNSHDSFIESKMALDTYEVGNGKMIIVQKTLETPFHESDIVECDGKRVVAYNDPTSDQKQRIQFFVHAGYYTTFPKIITCFIKSKKNSANSRSTF
jgi:hypothetical protein